jgi:hypothetical protein
MNLLSLNAVSIMALTVVSLAAAGVAQDAKPPASPAPDLKGPGCIVVQYASRAEQIFNSSVTFEYLYSNNVNAVKDIDRYQTELAKWKAKSVPKGDAPIPPFFNIETLTVWNWTGLKIIPLDRKHTEAELQVAIKACDAFVDAKATHTP